MGLESVYIKLIYTFSAPVHENWLLTLRTQEFYWHELHHFVQCKAEIENSIHNKIDFLKLTKKSIFFQIITVEYSVKRTLHL